MLVVVQNVQVSNVEPDERERREKLPVEVVEDHVRWKRKWLSWRNSLMEKVVLGGTMRIEMSKSAVKVSWVKKTSQVAKRSAVAATWEQRSQEEGTKKLCVFKNQNRDSVPRKVQVRGLFPLQDRGRSTHKWACNSYQIFRIGCTTG